MPGPDPAREQADLAAAEAAAIGGRPSSEPPSQEEPSEAARPVVEAGGGEAEGFEQAERELIEHASHGDQHAARQAIEDAPDESDDSRAAEGGEPDMERSSEREEDLP
ncbi:MAG: hypothetical protein JOY56_07255 [Solirubrobacterales bacterium]|nr:hypothetical protein [Solirubrobacterales bacterium]MBV8947378.1 hypothetical protein [Solirubrobacterales bacterium]MBV9366125.1 hypothetical protein [Solirubrobacterales bacterium]MBV9681996.1 hypothetical protein [Solirubrobacterales bacterium]MBV9807504.1 hypothetical protein [Solirubrobacterales bacterium]